MRFQELLTVCSKKRGSGVAGFCVGNSERQRAYAACFSLRSVRVRKQNSLYLHTYPLYHFHYFLSCKFQYHFVASLHYSRSKSTQAVFLNTMYIYYEERFRCEHFILYTRPNYTCNCVSSDSCILKSPYHHNIYVRLFTYIQYSKVYNIVNIESNNYLFVLSN